jgi:hypothetical protein
LVARHSGGQMCRDGAGDKLDLLAANTLATA